MFWGLLPWEEGSDLHRHLLHWIPGPLPIHPYHSIICAMFRHVPAVMSTPVVSAIWIGCMTSIIPPSTTIFFRTLFSGICSYPERKCLGLELQYCWVYSFAKYPQKSAGRTVFFHSGFLSKIKLKHKRPSLPYSKKERELGLVTSSSAFVSLNRHVVMLHFSSLSVREPWKTKLRSQYTHNDIELEKLI